MSELKWWYQANDLAFGPFTTAEKAEMDSCRTPEATYTWARRQPTWLGVPYGQAHVDDVLGVWVECPVCLDRSLSATKLDPDHADLCDPGKAAAAAYAEHYMEACVTDGWLITTLDVAEGDAVQHYAAAGELVDDLLVLVAHNDTAFRAHVPSTFVLSDGRRSQWPRTDEWRVLEPSLTGRVLEHMP